MNNEGPSALPKILHLLFRSPIVKEKTLPPSSVVEHKTGCDLYFRTTKKCWLYVVVATSASRAELGGKVVGPFKKEQCEKIP